MNLMSILVNLSIEDIQKIGYKLGVSGFFNSKAELMRQISIQLLNRNFMKHLIRQLVTEEKELLNVVMLTASTSHPTVSNSFENGATSDEMHGDLRIMKLKDFGLLYEVDGKLIIPEDLASTVQSCLEGDISADLFVPEPQGAEIRNDSFSFFYDIYHLLGYFYHNLVRVTKGGKLYSRNMEKLRTLLRVNESVAFPESFDIEHDDIRLYYILKCAKLLKVVEEKDQELYLTSYAHEWLKNEQRKIIKEIVDCFQDNYFQFYYETRQGLKILANVVEDDDWIGVEEFYAKVLTVPRRQEGEELNTDYLLYCLLYPLMYLGFIECAFYLGTLQSFKLTARGRTYLTKGIVIGPPPPDSPVIIQPNFEIMVPAELPFRERWMIDAMSVMVKPGSMNTYQISKESVLTCFKRGIERDEMLVHLNRLTEDNIPQNIYQTINDWAELYGKACFTRVEIVHCDNPEISQYISSIPELRGFIIGLIDEVNIVLKQNCIEEVREILEQNDIIPQQGILSSSDVFGKIQDKSSGGDE